MTITLSLLVWAIIAFFGLGFLCGYALFYRGNRKSSRETIFIDFKVDSNEIERAINLAKELKKTAL